MNYFPDDELRCKCGCGQLKFDEEFRELLNHMREESGFPWPVVSGYRCENHPIEARKAEPGEHTTGYCVDIAVSFDEAYEVLRIAFENKIPRIGVHQRGDERFIHLGVNRAFPHPTVWSY